MAFALLREIFAAVGSLITIPKWLIQRVLRPSRNFAKFLAAKGMAWMRRFGILYLGSSTPSD